MSSYIIAGSSDSLDTAYCEEIARRIKAKYKNIDFRIVIKHPSEWEEYLNQICRVYGFPKKSNPIIYTYHGKIVGGKEAFVKSTVKYFGLGEELLLVDNLTTDVNVKLTNEELERKNILKSNYETLSEKIQRTYDKLLKNGTLKYEFKTKSQFLVNGIEYFLREVEGICPSISFPLNQEVKVEVETIEASNLDLMAISAQDQVHVDDIPGGKEPFVTNNQTEALEKMSEASRTNRLHSSVMSKDEDSKLNRESNQEKQKILEEFDDVADYNEINMEQTFICDLGDFFCLAFEKNKSNHIPGEIIFYYNQSQNGANTLRVYNDGRPVIGHHTIIKEIHFIGDEENEENNEAKEIEGSEQIDEKSESPSKNFEENDALNEEKQQSIGEKSENKEVIEAAKEENVLENEEHQIKSDTVPKVEVPQISKTEENIPQTEAEKSKTEPQLDQIPLEAPELNSVVSEESSDLNIISHLNYHTLYILKPLSPLELKHLLNLIKETNAVACLQFLPENPNPKVRVYNRSMLLDSQNSLFPVESFIQKQFEDGELEEIYLPREESSSVDSAKIKSLKINSLGFNHIYYPHHENMTGEELSKVIKVGIDDILYLEERLKKEIGYNLVITKDFTLIVALTEPYRVYGTHSLYFDGLAYLGYAHIAKVVEGYTLKPQKIESGEAIRLNLAKCSSYELSEE